MALVQPWRRLSRRGFGAVLAGAVVAGGRGLSVEASTMDGTLCVSCASLMLVLERVFARGVLVANTAGLQSDDQLATFLRSSADQCKQQADDLNNLGESLGARATNRPDPVLGLDIDKRLAIAKHMSSVMQLAVAMQQPALETLVAAQGKLVSLEAVRIFASITPICAQQLATVRLLQQDPSAMDGRPPSGSAPLVSLRGVGSTAAFASPIVPVTLARPDGEGA